MPLRGVYWKKLGTSAVSGSVWQGAEAALAPEAIAFDADELEAAFGTRPAKATASDGALSTPRGGAAAHVSLLDMKRATNAGIALARLEERLNRGDFGGQ